MSRADYAHWNEDADYMWWHEEGKHVEEPPEPDIYDEHWQDYGIECKNESECMEFGNYDWINGTLWECSTCGRRFRKIAAGVWIPDETYARR